MILSTVLILRLSVYVCVSVSIFIVTLLIIGKQLWSPLILYSHLVINILLSLVYTAILFLFSFCYLSVGYFIFCLDCLELKTLAIFLFT